MDEIESLQRNLERRQQTLRQMGDDLQWLISQEPGRYRWISTQRDLLELVDIVWQQERCRDEQGRPLSRRELVDLAFRAVSRLPPRHVACLVQRIRNRSRPSLSLFCRYEQAAAPHTPHLLQHYVSH